MMITLISYADEFYPHTHTHTHTVFTDIYFGFLTEGEIGLRLAHKLIMVIILITVEKGERGGGKLWRNS